MFVGAEAVAYTACTQEYCVEEVLVNLIAITEGFARVEEEGYVNARLSTLLLEPE